MAMKTQARHGWHFCNMYKCMHYILVLTYIHLVTAVCTNDCFEYTCTQQLEVCSVHVQNVIITKIPMEANYVCAGRYPVSFSVSHDKMKADFSIRLLCVYVFFCFCFWVGWVGVGG